MVEAPAVVEVWGISARSLCEVDVQNGHIRGSMWYAWGLTMLNIIFTNRQSTYSSSPTTNDM